MWITLLSGGCFYDPNPSAFDWKIERTLVAAVSIWPVEAYFLVPRRIDALVLSPYALKEVRTDVCGLSTDEPVAVTDAACFSASELIEWIPGELPLLWTPPELAFACTGPVFGSYSTTGYTSSTGDTAVDTGLVRPTCGSIVPVQVWAGSDEDEASGVTRVTLFTEPYDPRGGLEPDPAEAAPTLALVEGTVGAGTEVLLRFSADSAFDGNYAWYADDGVFVGTGRTGVAGTDPDGLRTWTQNRLQIPDDYQGPLRVAVVLRSSSPVWAVTTLEVP